MGFVSAATLALAGIASPAIGQETDDEDANVEEVTVTGSRLQANPNLSAATPVLSVTGEEAQIRGNIRVEDFINVLPQVFAGQASEVSNGATGTATLDLRGLGSVRTLVLIDGRRLPYGSSSTVSANVDLVPIQMVERVDILTGGASAVYGSDAIGGVANFILKRNFEGVEFGGQWGNSFNDNGDDFFANVLNAGGQPIPGSEFDGSESLIYTLMGVNSADDRGNVTIYAAYEDRQEISQADRVFSGCALGQDDGPQSFGGLGCVGSANFRLFGGPGGFRFQEESGNLIPFAGGPSQTFNFGRTNFFQRPSERYNMYAKGYYQIADKFGAIEDVEAFADFSYVNNLSDAQIAPTASFGIGAYSINCDNPLIQNNPGESFLDTFGCTPGDVAAGTVVNGITASHRNVEGGERNSRLENSAWRLVSGLRGTLAEEWDWEAYAQVAETRDQSVSTNDFVVANLQQALLATTDADGNIVCTDPSRGCVPYNIFQRGPNGESLVSQEALNFIQGVGLVNGSTKQTAFGASIQANLESYGIGLPTADESVAVLFGIEARKDELGSLPDEISRIPGGGFTGVGGATLPVTGQLETTDFFTEIEIPLLAGKQFAEELTLRTQYRYSDYAAEGNDTSNDFDASAYGFSLAWHPVDEVRVRAQFQRAVRAPNVIELYTGQNTGLPNLSPAGTNANGVQLFDPCASDAPIETLANCERTGVTAATYGTILDVISGQTQSLTGGNPGLDPESADTVTFGLVWTPTFLENLTLSVDYFNILVEDTIQAGIPAQTVLDQCLATGNPTFCSLITRANSGTLAAGTFGVGFQQTNLNIAELETNGIDLQATYGFEIGTHSINLDYAATIINQLDTVPFVGADPIECAGFFGGGCGSPSPEYRHRAVATWKTPWDVDVVGTWRHFGETDNEIATEELETTLDSVNYIDVSANWYVTDDLVLRGSALNLFGQDPPIFSGAGPALGNGNTYPTAFDTGTVFVASFQYTF
ncbi:MAG: TonB-dependent receptor plug domain-containing protein [Gammaproteobacteria bacterium]